MKKLFKNPFVMIAISIVYVFSMAFISDLFPKEAWYAGPSLFFMFVGAGFLFLRTAWLLISIHHWDDN